METLSQCRCCGSVIQNDFRFCPHCAAPTNATTVWFTTNREPVLTERAALANHIRTVKLPSIDSADEMAKGYCEMVLNEILIWLAELDNAVLLKTQAEKTVSSLATPGCCRGCGMPRSKLTPFRPDPLGDIFSLCGVCFESIGLSWDALVTAKKMEEAVAARRRETDTLRKSDPSTECASCGELLVRRGDALVCITDGCRAASPAPRTP